MRSASVAGSVLACVRQRSWSKRAESAADESTAFAVAVRLVLLRLSQ